MMVIFLLSLWYEIVLHKRINIVKLLHFEDLNASTQFRNRILRGIETVADKDVGVDNLFKSVKA